MQGHGVLHTHLFISCQFLSVCQVTFSLDSFYMRGIFITQFIILIVCYTKIAMRNNSCMNQQIRYLLTSILINHLHYACFIIGIQLFPCKQSLKGLDRSQTWGLGVCLCHIDKNIAQYCMAFNTSHQREAQTCGCQCDDVTSSNDFEPVSIATLLLSTRVNDLKYISVAIISAKATVCVWSFGAKVFDFFLWVAMTLSIYSRHPEQVFLMYCFA